MPRMEDLLAEGQGLIEVGGAIVAADLATQAELDALGANVTSGLAGKQPLDADLTALAGAGNSAVLAATTASFLTADETKLDGIEPGAQVNAATYLEPQRLTSGEANIPRLLLGATVVGAGTGTIRLGYFTAAKTEACTKITSYSASPAASGLTLAKMGVYSVDGSGNLTLEAACASDTTLWTATSTAYQRTLTTTFNKVAGQRYAFGLIAVGTTGPNVHGTIPGSAAIAAIAPRVSGAVFGQTDLPSSVVVASVNDTSVFPFMFVTP